MRQRKQKARGLEKIMDMKRRAGGEGEVMEVGEEWKVESERVENDRCCGGGAVFGQQLLRSRSKSGKGKRHRPIPAPSSFPIRAAIHP
jgi:hypothetical protein